MIRSRRVINTKGADPLNGQPSLVSEASGPAVGILRDICVPIHSQPSPPLETDSGSGTQPADPVVKQCARKITSTSCVSGPTTTTRQSDKVQLTLTRNILVPLDVSFTSIFKVHDVPETLKSRELFVRRRPRTSEQSRDETFARRFLDIAQPRTTGRNISRPS